MSSVSAAEKKSFAPASSVPVNAAKPPLSMAMNFATAGLGGIFAWVIVHPFNTVAVQMSLATMSNAAAPGVAAAASTGATAAPKSLSFPKFFTKMVSERGVMSLYNGLSAGILRQVFYATSRFGLFEVMRDEYTKQMGKVDLAGRLLCGVASGGAAALISCPAEVTLVRLSNDSALPAEQRRNYKGVGNAFSRILAEEGIPAFFRGSGPFVNRAMIVGAVQVGTYDQLCATFKDSFGIVNKLANTFCAAMTAGLLYATVTMPLESCKNRMAFQKAGPDGKLPFTSTTQALGKIASQEGVLKLWTGFSPYYIRCGGHTVAMFMFIQWIREIIE
jgi:solute carrier family 25 oxoglutarate transporter 11